VDAAIAAIGAIRFLSPIARYLSRTEPQFSKKFVVDMITL
jgi:hypothetical protein